MTEEPTELHDSEPQEGDLEDAQAVLKGSSGRKSFAKLRRELSDEELTSPAVQRLLLDEIERLDNERSDLMAYRRKFHEADKRAAILEERFKGKIALEVIHVSCITVGAAALGYAPSIWAQQPTAWIMAIFGVILIAAGIGAKAVKP